MESACLNGFAIQELNHYSNMDTQPLRIALLDSVSILYVDICPDIVCDRPQSFRK